MPRSSPLSATKSSNYQTGTDVTACVEKEKLREVNDYLPLDF